MLKPYLLIDKTGNMGRGVFTKEEEKNGRFFLYPTQNVWNFILLDQLDGRVWQVQWSIEEKNRMVIRIN